MKQLLLIVAMATLAGCGSTSAPVAKTTVPVSTTYPVVVDQNGNPVVNNPYPLPPAPPKGDYLP